MMRIHVVFAAALVGFGAVACSSGGGSGAEGDTERSDADGDAGSDENDDEASSGTDTDVEGTGAGSGSSDSELASEASCSNICEPYLVCKGLDTSYQAECTEACLTQQFTEAELDSYEELDCAALVEAIEAARPGSGGSGAGSGSGNDDYQQSQECAYGECVRDGSYCVTFGTVTSDCPQDCCD